MSQLLPKLEYASRPGYAAMVAKVIWFCVALIVSAYVVHEWVWDWI
jgi:hypothetical protein